MDYRQRTLLASAGIVGIFLLVQLGALALVDPFQQGGLQGVEDTDDPSLSLLYVGAILVATLLMLGIITYGGKQLLRAVIIFAGIYIVFFVFEALVPSVGSVAGFSINSLVGLAVAIGLGASLYAYPEWYVIDTAGIVMGIGAAGLFGINFGILPALVLLVVLAVYDAISVYGTEHMLTLASGMIDMRVPVVFIVPLSLSYSFLEETTPETIADDDATAQLTDDVTLPTEAEQIDVEMLNDIGVDGIKQLDPELRSAVELDEEDLDALDEDVRELVSDGQRDALFIGLGDAVIPSVLVASAAFFVEAGPTISLLGISATLPAVTAMLGTTAGLVLLLWMVLQGRAHAGLPLLNGGAIAGYLFGALASGLSLIEALGLESVL